MKIVMELNLKEEDIVEQVINGDEEMQNHWEEDAEDFVDTYFDDIVACCGVYVNTLDVQK